MFKDDGLLHKKSALKYFQHLQVSEPPIETHDQTSHDNATSQTQPNHEQPAENVKSRLANLKSLLDDGLISQDEHDEQRTKIISEI